MASLSAFCTKQRTLLVQEMNCSETSDDRGSKIVQGLFVDRMFTVMDGGIAVTLVKGSAESTEAPVDNAPFCMNGFGVGDEVIVLNESDLNGTSDNVNKKKKKSQTSAVITAIGPTSLTLTITGNTTIVQYDSILPPPPLTLVERGNKHVFDLMCSALGLLEREGPENKLCGEVVELVFGDSSMDSTTIPSVPLPSTFPPLAPETVYNNDLTSEQRNFVEISLSRPLTLLHGPPGTGKTTALVELILQSILVHKMRVLCCCGSNVGVDNLLERVGNSLLSMHNVNSSESKSRQIRRPHQEPQLVRLGHPCRISELVRSRYSLQSRVQQASGSDVINDIKASMDKILRDLAWVDIPVDGTATRAELAMHKRAQSKARKGNNSNVSKKSTNRYLTADERKKGKRELDVLKKDLRSRERKIVEGLVGRNLRGSQKGGGDGLAVFCTNVGAGNWVLKDSTFDLVIIDEAAQSLEAACWIPTLKGSRLVLAGDHKQLPPTIKNHKAMKGGLGVTLFERVIEKRPDLSIMLTEQYRMHRDINDWASENMYNSALVPHPLVADRRFPFVSPLLLVDTSGCDDREESSNESGSKLNNLEASLVASHVEMLLREGIGEDDIAVVTPYNGQVEVLKAMLREKHPRIEIRSVDGFQGNEKEAIVISLVRSNLKKQVGFLSDNRRLNVAVTRARRHCCVVCDVDCVSGGDPFVKSLCDFIENRGEVISASEFDETESEEKGDEVMSSGPKFDPESILKDIETDINTDKQTKKGSAGGKVTKLNEGKKTSEQPISILEKISAFAEDTSPSAPLELRLADLSSYEVVLCSEFCSAGDGCGKLLQFERGRGNDASVIILRKKENVRENVGGIKVENSSSSDIKKIIRESESESSKLVVGFQGLIVDEDSSGNEDSGSDNNDGSGAESDDDGNSGSGFNGKNDRKEDVGSQYLKPMNSLLGSLAQERRQRMEEAKKTAETPQHQPAENKKKKNKKKKKKLQGRDDERAKIDSLISESDKDLDDMAFLDQQVEKVARSHGRKVEGRGKGYKRIINGILNKPPSCNVNPVGRSEKQKEASNRLRSNLAESASSRKAKTTAKKKKK